MRRDYATHDVRVLLAVGAAYTLAILPSWIQPFLLAELISAYGMDEASAGFVLTVEALLIASSSILCARVAASQSFLRLIVVGLGLVTLGNALSISVDGFRLLVASRVVAGAGGGMLLMVSSAAIAAMADSDRGYGGVNTLSVLSGMVAYAVAPYVISAGFTHVAFIQALLFVLFLAPLAIAMPRRVGIGSSAVDRSAVESAAVPQRRTQIPYLTPELVLIAIGVLLSCSVLASIWAFYYFLGERVGIPPEDINDLMVYVVGSCLVASILVSVIGHRYGRLGPLLAGITLMTVSIVCLALSTDPLVYRIFTAVNMFGFYVSVPFFLGFAAAADSSGRGAAMVSGVYLGGTSIGPYLGGVISGQLGVESFAWIAVLVNGIAVGLFVLVNQRLAKSRSSSGKSGG